MAMPMDPEMLYPTGAPEPADPTLATPLDPVDPTAPPAEPLAPPVLDVGMDEGELVALCREFWEEARSGREGGDFPRDQIWAECVDLYAGRADFSDKAEWQHKEVMRDATNIVDRMAASLKRAVMQPGGDWYTLSDLTPGVNLLEPHCKRIIDSQLLRCATTTSGFPSPFGLVLSRLAKLGGMMAMAASVTPDLARNRVRVDPVDPRELYYDPTGRGMYRIRRYEIDAHKLDEMAQQVDDEGRPLYFADRVASLEDMRMERGESDAQQMRGHTEGARPSARKTRVIHEFLFHELIDRQGRLVGKNVLVVMANEKRIIRGPEANPYWHDRDWIVYQPMIDVPLTVYGNSYMERFSGIANTFNDLTNLILDGTYVSMMRTFVTKPEMLADPSQIDEGFRPFKNWVLSDDAIGDAKDFIEAVDLGRLPREAVEVWSALKGQLRELSNQNQIELGQVPTKEATATEIDTVGRSSSELVMDLAENIDDGAIGPILELIFWNAIQFLNYNDPQLRREIGEPTADMMLSARGDFRQRQYRVKARAITGVAERARRAQTIMRTLQMVSANEILATNLAESHDLGRILARLWQDVGLSEPEYQRTDPAPAPTTLQAARERAASAERIAEQRNAVAMRGQDLQAAAAARQAEQQAAQAAAQRAAGEGAE